MCGNLFCSPAFLQQLKLNTLKCTGVSKKKNFFLHFFFPKSTNVEPLLAHDLSLSHRMLTHHAVTVFVHVVGFEGNFLIRVNRYMARTEFQLRLAHLVARFSSLRNKQRTPLYRCGCPNGLEIVRQTHVLS